MSSPWKVAKFEPPPLDEFLYYLIQVAMIIYELKNKLILLILTKVLKWPVIVILNDPPCNDDNAWFVIVSVKPWSVSVKVWTSV